MLAMLAAGTDIGTARRDSTLAGSRHGPFQAYDPMFSSP